MADDQETASSVTKAPRAQDGAAGVGGGTLLVLLAQNLPDDNPAKSWLVILAPSVTVVITYLWARLRFSVEDSLAQRSAKAAFEQARKTLREILDDPRTTEAHKTAVRRDLEELEKVYIDNTTARVKARLKDHGKPKQ